MLVLCEPPRAIHPDHWCGSFHRIEMVVFRAGRRTPLSLAEEYRRSWAYNREFDELFETRPTQPRIAVVKAA
jgi:hypothetical protein